jgi:hypothetical protein
MVKVRRYIVFCVKLTSSAVNTVRGVESHAILLMHVNQRVYIVEATRHDGFVVALPASPAPSQHLTAEDVGDGAAIAVNVTFTNGQVSSVVSATPATSSEQYGAQAVYC